MHPPHRRRRRRRRRRYGDRDGVSVRTNAVHRPPRDRLLQRLLLVASHPNPRHSVFGAGRSQRHPHPYHASGTPSPSPLVTTLGRQHTDGHHH